MIDAAVVAGLLACVPRMRQGFILPKLAAVVVLLALCVARRKEVKVSGRFALLLLVAIASAAASIDPSSSWVGFDGGFSYGIGEGVIYLLIMGFSSRRPWLKWIGSGLAAWAIAEAAWHWPSRAGATLGSPVDLGALLAMAFPVAGAMWPLVGLGIIATRSRAALLGALVAVTPRRWLWAWLFLPALLLLPMGRRDANRIDVWRVAAQTTREHPLLGTGPDTFYMDYDGRRAPGAPRQSHAHNDLLQASATCGLLGLLAYLWFAIPLLREPSLLALFVVAKFDPISFEVLCAAALVAGTYLNADG